jgi:predicted 3-demethylubiquinone-9 3-methyltransferase (glyoxalase superfamily)
MPEITTFLTFDNQAEEAVAHYLSIFEDGKVISKIPGPNGTVLGVTFELCGTTFMTLNGGPSFTFGNGTSLFVSCETQAEIDRYYDGLVKGGGKEIQCGWVTDKFGVTWQIVPKILGSLLSDKDRAKAGRAMQAMMGMRKLDIAALKRAFEGG